MYQSGEADGRQMGSTERTQAEQAASGAGQVVQAGGSLEAWGDMSSRPWQTICWTTAVSHGSVQTRSQTEHRRQSEAGPYPSEWSLEMQGPPAVSHKHLDRSSTPRVTSGQWTVC